jgi:hypothetical protein
VCTNGHRKRYEALLTDTRPGTPRELELPVEPVLPALDSGTALLLLPLCSLFFNCSISCSRLLDDGGGGGSMLLLLLWLLLMLLLATAAAVAAAVAAAAARDEGLLCDGVVASCGAVCECRV